MSWNTNLLRAGMALSLSFAFAGCGEDEPAEPTPVAEATPPEPEVEAPVEEPAPEEPAELDAPTPEELAAATETGEIAREIDADPDKAEAIVAERATDVATFEARLYRIAAHPELTEAFLAARAPAAEEAEAAPAE